MRALRARWRTRVPAGAYSLRRRLIVSVLGASVLVWLVSLALVVHVAWKETSDVFDDALKEGARLVLALGPARDGRGDAGDPDERQRSVTAKLALHYQLVSADGRVLRRAEEAPQRPFSTSFERRKGYENVWVEGRAWRVYLLRADGMGPQVQIGQPWDERLELLDEMAEDLAWPMLGMLVLLGGFCWFMIRRLMQPIERTAERIAAKSPQDLAPVEAGQEPRELQPIVQALNLVLGRLGHALQAERRFTADAAHELRTPLAALRMRIQLMQRQQASARPAEPPVDLQSLRNEVDRCTALTEKLLALARLDPERPETLAREPVDVDALFARLAAAVPGEAAVDWHADAGARVLRVQPALFESALCNLLDNARRYGRPGGRVSMRAEAVGRTVRIAVSDDGPGVSDTDRARLAERFFRVLGTGESGSGLGLSIVARIVALHGGTLRFGAGIGGAGLSAVMEFPAD